jgi:uncharacterized protein YndB with AHSA1/START domain
MRPVRAHVTISAPREQVYDFVADLAARVAWCDHYQRDYRLTRPRSSGVGAAARYQAKAPGFKTWVEVSVVEASRPRAILWTEPATRLDALKESFGARGWLKRQVKTSLSRLRKIFEEQPDAPLARATIAGYEPAKAARFGSF